MAARMDYEGGVRLALVGGTVARGLIWKELILLFLSKSWVSTVRGTIPYVL